MKTKIIEKFHLTFTQSSEYAVSFCKWLVCSTGIGLICGLIGSLFYKSIEYVTFIREANPTLIYFLPFAGLIIVWLYNRLGVRHDRGTNLILDSIHSHEQIPTALAPLIYIGTTITHLFGGSSGREGAALQMGGCIGVTLGKRLHMSEKDINVLTMCGMSAVFTAMFGTPITATIFSMEVISVGVFHYSAFVPCVLASTTAYGISTLFSIQGETFLLTEVPSITISTSAKIILLSILCGIIAIIFCQLIHGTLCLFRKYLTNHYLRIFIGGSIVSFI